MMVLRLFVLVLLALVGALVYKSLPDIQREIKIKQM